MGINFSILVKSAGIYHPVSPSGDDDKNYQAILNTTRLGDDDGFG